MKKKLLSLGVIVICIAILASGTIAYFSAEDTAHNVITSNGGVGVEIVEKTLTDSGELVDFPEQGITGLMPGESASKIVSLCNSGSSEAWLRVRISEQLLASDGTELPLTTRTGKPILSYEIDPALWQYQDGWYYYQAPVPAGAYTELLFDTVLFSVGMTNEYVTATAHVIIDAQAVQTANNGTTVLEAKGWPMEVTD